jgi:hypothetical protein
MASRRVLITMAELNKASRSGTYANSLAGLNQKNRPEPESSNPPFVLEDIRTYSPPPVVTG